MPICAQVGFSLEKPIELAEAQDVYTWVSHAERYQIIIATGSVVDAACLLLERYPLRAYDATHLAAAIEANRLVKAQGYTDLTFLSADNRLNNAAFAEGLTVDNPNKHP